MGDFDGKVAIITGGARGIGEATARALVAAGAKVMITDVLTAEGKAVAGDLGDDALFHPHDVRDGKQWAVVVGETEGHFGRVDILVNNAGVGGAWFQRLEDTPVEDVRSMVDINLMGTIIGMQTAIPALRRTGGGTIINISSTNGIMSSNALSIYSATKWAVRGLTKAAALELGPDNIRVCSVHPGGVDTPMANVQGLSREEFNRNFQNFPLRRACDPAEIAEGILFLASAHGAYCTGNELVIDGGLTAGVYYPGLPGSPDFEE